MKNLIISGVIVVAAGLLAPQTARSQGTTYISSLDQPSAGSLAVGNDSWLAALFITGNNPGGYALDSVQLAMTSGSGAPNGFTAMLYSFGNTLSPPLGQGPGSSLGTMSGSTDPVTGGLFTYTCGLALSPSRSYFIVLTAGKPVASGAYAWSFENTSLPGVSGGWTTGSSAYTSSDGLSWHQTLATPPQFDLTATAVPEPDTLYLLGLPGLLFFAWRRWLAKAQPHTTRQNILDRINKIKNGCREDNSPLHPVQSCQNSLSLRNKEFICNTRLLAG